MSRVFVATETSLGRTVVLKVLPPELAAQLSTDRFRREIEVSARLQHPHIVPLLAAGSAGELLYYTMPLIEGESLRARLVKSGELPVGEAVRLLRDTADALAYAHERGLVHRDIKPDNVLLTAGHAVVTDFGVAKAMSESAGGRGGDGITSVGLALGTPLYMAPEQGAADPMTDYRADLYAFGVMAYEMLTGQPPFTGRSAAALVAAHAAEPPEPIDRRRPGLPPGLSALVMRCLEKRPADRPQSAREIVNLLDGLATPPSGTTPLPAPVAGRKGWGAIAAAMLVAAIALAGVFWLRRAARAPVAEDIAVIAAVPPTAASGDTALARIGRDLAMLLSANLDGQGNLRLSDPQTILAQLRGESASLDRAREIARMLRAGAVLYGGLVRNGQRIRVELSLYRADSAVRLATLTGEAPPDSLSALTDSLAWSLLRQIWRGRDAPTPTVAALTTRSWSAMRAFLRGEAAFAGYRMQEAEDAYLAAVEADSAFWLAWHRLNYIRSAYLLRGTDTAIRNRVWRHLDELPDRERRMIEVVKVAAASPEEDRRLSTRARYQAILRDYPDYWWGWWVLADNSFHGGGLIHGTSREETIAELRRVTELNPAFVPAWSHLAGALFLRDSTGWQAALDAAAPATSEVPWIGLPAAWADPTRATLPDTQAVRAAMASVPVADMDVRMPYWMAAGSPQLAVAVIPALVRDPRAAAKHDDLRRAESWAWAGRGDWDSALTLAGTLRERGPFEGYRLAVVGAWLGGVPAEVVASWKRRLGEAPGALTPRDRTEIAWLEGIEALARGDAVGVSAARGAVVAGGDPSGPLLARALGAIGSIMTGSPRPAADTLAEAEFDRRWLPSGADGWQIPVAIPVHRLIAARSLAAGGDTTAALRQLNWLDDFTMVPARAGLLGIFSPYALLERARLYEARGDTLQAQLDYEQLLRRFDRPVKSLHWMRDEASQAHARLKGVPQAPGR